MLKHLRSLSFRTSCASSFRTEFRYGSFQRIIPLPASIQNTEVKAEYKNGILYLTLPKAEAEKNKVVKVNLSDKVDAQ
jgi:HSP20 family protein